MILAGRGLLDLESGLLVVGRGFVRAGRGLSPD